MRTKITRWIDGTTNKELFGIAAWDDGEWKNVAEHGKPLFFTKLAKAEAKRAEIRRTPREKFKLALAVREPVVTYPAGIN